MTDFLALAALLLVLGLVLAKASGAIVPWVRNEIALMRAETWQGEHLINPRLGSLADERVARVDMKRKRLGKRMKKQGRSLLAKKEYTPVLTKKAEDTTTPPRADKVVPIRRSA
jgi:hypothetical protein